MAGLRYGQIVERAAELMDLTSLTREEFDSLLPAFETAFQERMSTTTLAGTPRTGRGFVPYANRPLPTPADRLLFILVYLKTNPIQTLQGVLFGMPQNKTNQWIHTLLPVLQTALQRQGDAPARTQETLEQQIQHHVLPPAMPPLLATMGLNGASPVPKTLMNRKAIIAARKNVTPSKTSC